MIALRTAQTALDARHTAWNTYTATDDKNDLAAYYAAYDAVLPLARVALAEAKLTGTHEELDAAWTILAAAKA